jgi:RNA polymerase sigma-70 factor, ECF subfamily
MQEQLLRDMEGLIPVLRRYARFLVSDPHAADTLVQNCLERAVCDVGEIRADTNLRAWLLTVMRKCLADGKTPARGPNPAGLNDAARAKAWSPGREEHTRLIDELGEAFLNLPDPQKLAMICVVFEGLPYDQAAAVLAVSVGTVKSRVLRGREALRRTIAADPLQETA